MLHVRITGTQAAAVSYIKDMFLRTTTFALQHYKAIYQ